jgi:putative addiction module component (TIGR02574 family)
MDKTAVLEAVRALEPADRWEVAETILNELESGHLSEEMKAFLDSRIADFEQNRDKCLPFEEVAARTRARYGR